MKEGFSMEFREFPKLSLTVPAKTEWIEMAAVFVRKGARSRGYSLKEQSYYELAAEEVFSGLLEGSDEEGAVTVLLRDAPLGMEVLFRDRGIPVDTDSLPVYDPSSSRKEENVPGLRIFLVRSFMDELVFENRGIQGREVRLVRYRFSPVKTEVPSGNVPAPSEPGNTERALPKSWEIRSMQPEEALEVSRCAWSAYGYSYCEHIYYPERVRELNARGKVRSFVAVTGKGEIMGHAWLSFPPGDSGIAEMGAAFVNPRFRGLGCLGRFSRVLQEEARKENLEGVFVESVTVHTYSQKPVHRDGFGDCALLVGKIGITRFRKIDEEERQRLSLLLSFRFLDASPALRRFVLPPQHEKMLRRIYAHLGVPLEVAEFCGTRENENRFEGRTELQVTADMQHKSGDIWLTRYGQDTERELRRAFRGLCYEGFAGIYLYLPLWKEETAFFCSKAEEQGFFFGGILPGSSGKDWLVLQYLHDVLLNYEEIQCEDPLGKDLLAYIRSMDPEADLRRKS